MTAPDRKSGPGGIPTAPLDPWLANLRNGLPISPSDETLPDGFDMAATQKLFGLQKGSSAQNPGHPGESYYEIKAGKPKDSGVAYQIHYQEDAQGRYLVFAGTRAPFTKAGDADIATDVKVKQRPFVLKGLPGPQGPKDESEGSVHSGFLDYWNDVSPQVCAALDSKKNDSLPIFITGHSLGGAVAMLASMELKKRGYPVKYTVTEGAPAVGNAAWAKNYDALGIPTFQFVEGEDPVPRSLDAFASYHHGGKSIYLDHGKRLNREKTDALSVPPWMARLAMKTWFLPPSDAVLGADLAHGAAHIGSHDVAGYESSFKSWAAGLGFSDPAATNPSSASPAAPSAASPSQSEGLPWALYPGMSVSNSNSNVMPANRPANTSEPATFEHGGPVSGASHSAGGIPAELEGGENIWSRKDVHAAGGQQAVESLKQTRASASPLHGLKKALPIAPHPKNRSVHGSGPAINARQLWPLESLRHFSNGTFAGLDSSKSQALLSVAYDDLKTNPDWLWELINMESGHNPVAENPDTSAKGLIQIIDTNAVTLGFKNSFDLIGKFPNYEEQMRGPVKGYLTRINHGPYPTRQSLFMSVFFPAARNVAPQTTFDSLYEKVYAKKYPDKWKKMLAHFKKTNPGINTVEDYVDDAVKKPPPNFSVAHAKAKKRAPKATGPDFSGRDDMHRNAIILFPGLSAWKGFAAPSTSAAPASATPAPAPSGSDSTGSAGLNRPGGEWITGPAKNQNVQPPPARKLQFGGPISGASHSGGGIPAELEGGENVWSRRDVSAFGGQGAVEWIKRLGGSLGGAENPAHALAPGAARALDRHAAHASVAHRHHTHHHHDVHMRVTLPPGIPDDQRKMLEETARKAARDVLRRSIEHVSQSNPKLEGVA